jgi:hypothetical protein
VKFGGRYKPIDQLDQIEKVPSPCLCWNRSISFYCSNKFGAFHKQNLVDSLKQVAYQNIDDIQSSYKMVNNYPVPQRFPAQDTPLLSPVLPNQRILNYGNIFCKIHS